MKIILVVDDDDGVRDILCLALLEFGYRPLQARNGIEAVEVLKGNPEIDIVILDLKMPLMSGHETCAALKNLNPEVKIIISSGFVEEKALRQLQSLGVKCILRKPYPLSLLQEIINDHSGCRGMMGQNKSFIP